MARVFDARELANLEEVLRSGQLGWREGGMVTRFEQAFAQLVGARYGIARNSAMTGLAQAVSISGAGTGWEVLCDPVVQFGGLSALYFNAVPRFVDVRRDTLLMDPDSLRANITPRSKAVVVTHLWGQCAEIDAIKAICDEHGLFLIEDCAHAVGARWKGRHAGTWGDLGVFSFQQSKQLTTGDGCVMVTDREDLHHRLYHEWAFGESPTFMTLNFRMNELTAAVGLAQVDRVMAYVDAYTTSRLRMDRAIAGCRWLTARRTPAEAHHVGYIWTCIWDGDRHGLELDDFKRLCQEARAGLGFGFTKLPAYQYGIFGGSTAYGVPDCPTRCPFYTRHSNYRYGPGLCPVAEDVIPRLITTGLVETPPAEVERRAEALAAVIRRMES